MQYLITLILILCPLISIALPPGSAYIGIGFDAAYGTLRPSNLNEVSRSFVRPNIYIIDFDDDVDQKPLPAAELTISVQTINTVNEYLANQTADLNLGFGFGGSTNISFHGSADFKFWAENRTIFFEQLYMSDSVFTVHSLTMNKARLSQFFQSDFFSLPTTYTQTNKPIFFNFIDKWGTHYVESAAVGGRLTFRSFTSQQTQTFFTTNGVNAQLGINLKMRELLKLNYNSGDSNFIAVNNSDITISIFGYGGNTGEIRNYDAWRATVPGNPLPITLKLAPYLYILNDSPRRDALKQALVEYFMNSLALALRTPENQFIAQSYFELQPFPVPDNGYSSAMQPLLNFGLLFCLCCIIFFCQA